MLAFLAADVGAALYLPVTWWVQTQNRFFCHRYWIVPEISLFCHWTDWSLRETCCFHLLWREGFSTPSVSFSDSFSLPRIAPVCVLSIFKRGNCVTNTSMPGELGPLPDSDRSVSFVVFRPDLLTKSAILMDWSTPLKSLNYQASPKFTLCRELRCPLAIAAWKSLTKSSSRWSWSEAGKTTAAVCPILQTSSFLSRDGL